MIDFSRSTFTWHAQPWTPDPYYRYAGGFVGKYGQVVIFGQVVLLFIIQTVIARNA